MSLVPQKAEACRNRRYNRLNKDYEALHAMCRFFLEHSGPAHRRGDWSSWAFLINMPQLFELFVAQWMQTHLDDGLALDTQRNLVPGRASRLNFIADLVLYDRETRVPVAVLDTKYKAAESPSTDDVAQVIAYAEILGCRNAFLVYPRPLERSLDSVFGEIRVRAASFSLDGDLDEAGYRFLAFLRNA